MLPRMSETTQPAERVRAPGIVLAIFGGLAILMQLASFAFTLIGMPIEEQIRKAMMESGGQPPPPEMEEFLNSGLLGAMNAFGILTGILALALAAYVLWGGLQMIKLRHHGACIGAAVVAMLPCTASCCCLIGIPIAIWVILVLNRADVRSAFGASSSN